MAPRADHDTTIAFAGAGFITAVHGLAVDATEGLRATKVASRTFANATKRAEGMGAEPCTYDELPAGADIVFVTTPPARHVLDAMAALQGGAKVIVEKPLATTLADADRLVDAAEPGGRVAYAENLAYAPVIVEAIERIGGLGTVHHLELQMLQSRPHWGDFLTASWGGGVLFDLGVHPIAIALLLAAPARPVEVRAQLEGADDIDVDEHADLTITFDSGLRAHVTTSWRQAPDDSVWDLQAASATGVLRVELAPNFVLEVDGEPVARPAERADLPSPLLERMGYTGQLDAFTTAFAAGRDPSMSASFGREVLDLVCAAYASAGNEGSPEPLPFRGDRTRTPLELWGR